MSNEMLRREFEEAIVAGERVLATLQGTQKKLNSIDNWNIRDLIATRMFPSNAKRSKMNEAHTLLKSAKNDLVKFQIALKEVTAPLELRMEIGSFLSFSDFFFDGSVTDYLVQSKLPEAKSQISDTINRVEQILDGLRKNI